MNFGEKEKFYERHRYFFLNYSFQFEGLEPLLQQKFETIVKQLSGTVSEDADYTLCEETYFNRHENKNRTDLFKLSYILDSIEAKEPLDIKKYRFTPTAHSEYSQFPCCLISKYVLRTNSCLRYYHDNVSCQYCSSNVSNNDNMMPQNPTHVHENRKRKNGSQDGKEAHTDNLQNKNGYYHDNISSQKCSSNVSNNDNLIPQNPTHVRENRKRKNESQGGKEIHTDNLQNENCNAMPKTKKPKRIVFVNNNWTMVNNELDDVTPIIPVEQERLDNNINNDSANDNCSINSDVLLDMFDNDSSDDSSTITINNNKWWQYLPRPNESKNVTEKMYDKGQRRKGRVFSIHEKRQMIAYLILRNKINQGTCRSVWREMQAEGYLNDRSVESICHHFRKIILPNINTFGLPDDIVLKF